MPSESRFAPPTPAVAQALEGRADTEQRATPAAAFHRARQMFREGTRLDMVQLASELGVARATLYRWTGDRARLLSDVAWADLEAILADLDSSTPGRGVDRLAAMAGRLIDALAGNPSLSAFLTHEGKAGLRLLTAPTGGVRPRIVAAVTRLIDSEVERGAYAPPDWTGLIADGIVSLSERFLYHAGDPAMNPDPETAKRVMALLLRENP